MRLRVIDDKGSEFTFAAVTAVGVVDGDLTIVGPDGLASGFAESCWNFYATYPDVPCAIVRPEEWADEEIGG